MKQTIASLIFLSVFGALLYTSVPTITDDDSGELSSVGAVLGIGHSPGYPIYSMAGKIAYTLVPWANMSYRVNLASSLFIALAAVVFFFAASEISGSILAGVVTSLLFSFSGLVWAMGNTTEVYGIAAFLTCLLCLVMVKELKPSSYILVFYLLGIGMTAHYTIGLLLPGLIWWYGAGYIFNKPDGTVLKYSIPRLIKSFPNVIVFGLIGFSVVLFILIRAKQNPVISWEDPQDLNRFWQVIARLRYGSLSLAQGGAPPLALEIIFGKIYFFFKVLVQNFTYAGLILFLYGVYACLKDKFRGWSFLILLIGSGPGFLILANVTLTPGSESLLKRFFFLPFIFVVFIIAEGLKKLPKSVSGAALFLPLFLVYNNFPEMNTRQRYIFYDHAKNMLKTVPRNTILFSDRADEMEFELGYLHIANRQRPDIEFTDCNAGITKSIYGDDYYKIWGKPRLKIREAVEKSIIERTDKNVYYATFDPNMINIPRYQEGLLFRTKPAKALKPNFPYEEIYALRYTKDIENRELNILNSYFDLMGRYYLFINDPVRADRFFGALSVYDKAGYADSTIGFQFHNKNQLELAEKYYKIAISKNAADKETFINLGAIYEKKGENDKAKETYYTVLSIDPNNIQTHYNLAVLYWKEADWQKVISEFETVLALDPNRVDARGYLEMARAKVHK